MAKGQMPIAYMKVPSSAFIYNMKFQIISVGRIKDKNILNLINLYSERINYDAKIEFIEIKDSVVSEESKRISEIIYKSKDKSFVFVLAEEGKELSSVELAEKIKKISSDGTKIVFVIGGAYGLDNSVKQKANFILSLSKMTFTHEMSRLFLAEQIYRAISIIKNRRYHH